jgi:hypothetical protein
MRDMKLAALYLVTSVATAFHVFYQMMWTIWGAPRNPFHYVSMIGSAILLVSAVIALFRPRVAARVGMVGCVAAWCFYGPALVYSYFDLGFWNGLWSAFSTKQYVPAVGAIISPILLTACTVYTSYFLKGPSAS